MKQKGFYLGITIIVGVHEIASCLPHVVQCCPFKFVEESVKENSTLTRMVVSRAFAIEQIVKKEAALHSVSNVH